MVKPRSNNCAKECETVWYLLVNSQSCGTTTTTTISIISKKKHQRQLSHALFVQGFSHIWIHLTEMSLSKSSVLLMRRTLKGCGRIPGTTLMSLKLLSSPVNLCFTTCGPSKSYCKYVGTTTLGDSVFKFFFVCLPVNVPNSYSFHWTIGCFTWSPMSQAFGRDHSRVTDVKEILTGIGHHVPWSSDRLIN